MDKYTYDPTLKTKHFESNLDKMAKPVKSAMGLLVTLLFATLAEMIENAEFTIERFRQNSGTSETYQGDSTINVIGDLVSCSLGYNLAKYLSSAGYDYTPLGIFLFNELFLALVIRDNLFLIMLQLASPNEK